MFTRYGTDNLLALVASGTLLITSSLFINESILTIFTAGLGVVIILFACWFFRDPKRTVPQEALSNDTVVIAPADGKIVQIITLDEPRLIQGRAQRISIFLSPLDVHVNRVPANGTIVFSEYKPGKFLVAMDHRASEENEQTIIGLRNSAGSLIFKQMTGVLARRIVCEAKAGDVFKAGDKFGMMKFGSRMDIIVPENAQILVQEGQRVVGGESLMCRLHP
jgi:phosphatidylserine decarboxylase